MTASSVVLVTGASGYLAASVVLDLICKGYRVKATVVGSISVKCCQLTDQHAQRSQDKAEAFIAKHPDTKPFITWTIVKDSAEPGAFDEAVRGVDYIIHVASPFHFKPTDNERDILRPAVVGTKNILESALAYGSIERFVLTSSYAAIMDYAKGYNVGAIYNDETWSPATWEEALKSQDGGYVYFASKVGSNGLIPC